MAIYKLHQKRLSLFDSACLAIIVGSALAVIAEVLSACGRWH